MQRHGYAARCEWPGEKRWSQNWKSRRGSLLWGSAVPFCCGGMPRFKAHLRDGRRKLADVEVDVRWGPPALSGAPLVRVRPPAASAVPLKCLPRGAGVTNGVEAGGGEDQEAAGVRPLWRAPSTQRRRRNAGRRSPLWTSHASGSHRLHSALPASLGDAPMRDWLQIPCVALTRCAALAASSRSRISSAGRRRATGCVQNAALSGLAGASDGRLAFGGGRTSSWWSTPTTSSARWCSSATRRSWSAWSRVRTGRLVCARDARLPCAF